MGWARGFYNYQHRGSSEIISRGYDLKRRLSKYIQWHSYWYFSDQPRRKHRKKTMRRNRWGRQGKKKKCVLSKCKEGEFKKAIVKKAIDLTSIEVKCDVKSVGIKSWAILLRACLEKICKWMKANLRRRCLDQWVMTNSSNYSQNEGNRGGVQAWTLFFYFRFFIVWLRFCFL